MFGALFFGELRAKYKVRDAPLGNLGISEHFALVSTLPVRIMAFVSAVPELSLMVANLKDVVMFACDAVVMQILRAFASVFSLLFWRENLFRILAVVVGMRTAVSKTSVFNAAETSRSACIPDVSLFFKWDTPGRRQERNGRTAVFTGIAR